MKTFLLPDLGEGLQDAEIVSWHVGVGDHVVADQPLVSVETAKAVIEVPSPWSGRVAKLHGAAGDIVIVGEALVDLDTDQDAEDAGTVVGTLPKGPDKSRPVPSARPEVGTLAAAKASPAVRKRAAELGIDPRQITGTGPEGSVTCDDVEKAAGAQTSAAGYVVLRGVRRAMADTMTRIHAGVVPASVTDEAVLQSWLDGTDPTIRLVRAMVAGCRAAPGLNAWFDGAKNALVVHDKIDLGIAMETDDGLFVPVLRDVADKNSLSLRESLDAMKRDVAGRSVPFSELRGQTITLSNFGMFGGLHALLTIASPQVAILGAGRIHLAARVVDGDIRAVRIMPLSLTFDHRVVTGAEAVGFLNAVIADLEQIGG